MFEVEVNKEESPSIFNEKRLPKTVSSNQFIGVITATCTLRTKIMKAMKNIVAAAKEITNIESEAGDIDEDFIEGLHSDIQNEYVKMKERLKEHEDKTSQIRTMTGFIINTNKTSKQPLAIKSRDDAGKALEEAERHEEELENSVRDWKATNVKFLARKKKKPETQSVVTQPDAKQQSDKVWLATFEKKLIPKENLTAASDISEMKSFKK